MLDQLPGITTFDPAQAQQAEENTVEADVRQAYPLCACVTPQASTKGSFSGWKRLVGVLLSEPILGAAARMISDVVVSLHRETLGKPPCGFCCLSWSVWSKQMTDLSPLHTVP